MNQGHVKLHCKIQEWEWYSTPYMFHLFMHIVMSANTENRNRGRRVVSRGQLLTTLNKLVEETGISKRSIRTCLERLRNTGEISIEPTKLYSVITVNNYNAYQIDDNCSDIKEQQEQTLLTPVVSPSVKKPRKKSEPKTIVSKAREVFEKYFLDTYQDVYYWTAKDAGQMKALLNKIKFRRESRNLPVEESDLLDALSIFLNSITDIWICQNFSVTNIASKYNEIVAQAKMNKENGNVKSASCQESSKYSRLEGAASIIKRLEEEEK